MKIPSFIDSPVVDQSGRLTETWRQILQQILQQMQINLSDEGVIIPQQTTANITTLSTQKSIGAIVYDSNTDEFKACIKKVVGPVITGEFKKIQLV